MANIIVEDCSSSSSGGESDQYSSNSSGQSNGGDDKKFAFSNFDAGAGSAAAKKSPGSSSSSDDDESSIEATPARRDLLDDFIEDKLAPATHGRTTFEIGDVEETIVFHEDPKSPSSPRRSNQEYYDVLEMASNRLREHSNSGGALSMTSSSEHDYGNGHFSSGDEAVRKRKKKKKKTKREKNRTQRNKSEDEDYGYEEEFDTDRRSSSMSESLFPNTFPSTSVGNSPGYEADMDPNDDLPSRWNPASLVTTAQSRKYGKTDENGFYKNMMGRASSAYGKVQSKVKGKQEEMPDSFNLQSIRKSRRRKGKSTRKDIFWGSESIVTAPPVADHESPGSAQENRGGDNGIDSEDDEDDYNFSPFYDISQHYLLNQQLVEKRRWRKNRRRLGIVLLVTVVLFSVCLALFLSRRRNDGSENYREPPPSSTQPKIDHGILKDEAPKRPLPLSPVEPTEWNEGSGLHTITVQKLLYIVNQITPDSSILNDPTTPQSKALAWAKEDMKIYNVEVEPRVAQRYALATLFHATNGTGWKANLKWGSGHECEWYGVGCETGEDNMVSVTYLDLGSNHLDGVIPPEIGYITSLKQIHLWGNNLVGSIPSTLSKLANLHTLYLDKNRLDGEMADTFNPLKNMKHLDLSGNRLRGHIPHGLGTLINLRDLRLSNNFFTGTFPTSLISLSNLQTLLLDSNSISGSLPSLVGEMRSLVTIRIHENDLKGSIPDFSDAERLEEAHFDGNYFTGQIPHFGSIHLRDLYLGRNSLSGDIPESIGKLVKLEIFDANSNELTGSIPSSMSNASALQFLDLSHNKLTGSIPISFSNFLELHELRLDHNRLSGRFPDWLGTLKHIELVHLNSNLLEGSLSLNTDMGDLDDLTEFAIENNDLEGIVGEAMCDLLLDVLTADCWGSPPRMDCSCCTECF